ncbi:MAG: ATP-grasp domain-containing protein, partial [Microbacteriaceae bacterium]
MMTPVAINLGLDFRVLAEVEGSSAQLAATQIGDYRDLDTVLNFAKSVDTITFDHEHVPQHILSALLDAGKSVQPGPAALRLAQNKIVMRQELQKLGLPMPVWAIVQDASELTAFLEAQGGRCIVKTPTGGYDGKGVRLISDAAEAADWFAASPNQPLLAEEAVDFVRELAQLSARST